MTNPYDDWRRGLDGNRPVQWILLAVGGSVTLLFGSRLVRVVVAVVEGDLTLGRALLGFFALGLLTLGGLSGVARAARRLRGHRPPTPDPLDPALDRRVLVTAAVLDTVFVVLVAGAFRASDDQRESYVVLAALFGVMAVPLTVMLPTMRRRMAAKRAEEGR